jgi:hypothetical protein
MGDSGRIEWKKPLDMDAYKRLYEGWLPGNARGSVPSEIPVAVAPVAFQVIEMDLEAGGTSYGRVYLRAYVTKSN